MRFVSGKDQHNARFMAIMSKSVVLTKNIFFCVPVYWYHPKIRKTKLFLQNIMHFLKLLTQQVSLASVMLWSHCPQAIGSVFTLSPKLT